MQLIFRFSPSVGAKSGRRGVIFGMKRFLLLSLLLVLDAFGASAQTYFNRQHALEPLGYSGGVGLLATDSGYTALGWGSAGPPYNRHVLVAFFDARGQARRHRLFARPGGQIYVSGLEALPDGGFFTSGTLDLPITGSYGQLWRFTAAGDTLWTRTYLPAPGQARLRLNQQCYVPADSGFALVGSQQLTSFPADLVLLRTDKNGRERWRRTFREQPFNKGFQIRLTLDGGFLLAGQTAPNSGGGGPFNSDWLVIKTDADGQEQWRYVLDGPHLDAASTAVCLPDGTYLIAGWVGTGETAADMPVGRSTLVHLDAQGQELWRRAYGPEHLAGFLCALHLLPDGGVVLAGQGAEPLFPQSTIAMRAFALKACAATGDSLWYRSYGYFSGPSSSNYPTDFIPTPDGGFVGTGYLHPGAPDPNGPQPIWLFKTDEHGYVTAGGTPPPTVACPRLVGVAEEAGARVGVEVWPNPSADGRFAMRATSAPGRAGGRLVVTDALGRLVWRGALAGPDTRVDLSREASGVYTLRLLWPDGRGLTRKLVR